MREENGDRVAPGHLDVNRVLTGGSRAREELPLVHRKPVPHTGSLLPMLRWEPPTLATGAVCHPSETMGGSGDHGREP